MRELPGASHRTIGAITALALAAASTGVIVPALKLLVERTGHSSFGASVFMVSHVLGGALGAALGARALRLAGSARTLAAASLVASVVATLAMAAVDPLELRIALRFVEGVCHLLAITAVVAAATSGDPERRAHRAVTMGVAIVLGVASGLGLGAVVAHPEAAFVVAALLSGGALICVILHIAPEPPPESPNPSRDRGPLAPGMLAFGERFLFGLLTLAAPFLASPSRVGVVLGVFMVAAVAAIPLSRRYAMVWGARRLAVRSSLALAAMIGLTGAVDVFASIAIALAWAPVCGAAAGALYACALVLVGRSASLEDRLRDMASVHAGGNAGFAAGLTCAGLLISHIPAALVVAAPGVLMMVATWLGVVLALPAPTPAPRDRGPVQPVT